MKLKKKLPEPKSFNLENIYGNNRPENDKYKKLAENFNRSYDFSPRKATEIQKIKLASLPGPKSYKVPQISKPKFYNNGPPDEWQGYNSHKYLPINLVQDYIEERPYLPLPPSGTNQTL